MILSPCDRKLELQNRSLRLGISGNTVVNNAQFLAQSCHFTAQDLSISSAATGINFVLPVPACLTLKVMVAVDLHIMNNQEP